MNDWKAKRFWDTATAVAVDNGFSVQLDARPVRTPAKQPLIVPTRAMADAIAVEWDAQDGAINPATMPVTRSANAAIDKVQIQTAEVAQMIADYGDSDLICYRADQPDELVSRQNTAWDPLINWASTVLDAPLQTRVGVMHAPQNAETLARLTHYVQAFSPFEMTALHDLVSLSGSLIIGLAVTFRYDTADTLWQISRTDEQFQIDAWGVDDEAEILAVQKQHDFLHADRFFRLALTDS